MRIKPFLKWAGGKRWLLERDDFTLPEFEGRYIEPFLGGGAMFFGLRPKQAIISDVNGRLVELYLTIRDESDNVLELLKIHQRMHSKEYYYEERSRKHTSRCARAAQFIYLNRTCWNGLYRENLNGEFNVPIGTKSIVISPEEDFSVIADVLKTAEILCCDFEKTMEHATEGDLIFVDPPYTTAHNFNGFVKYNQKIFTWADQVRLRDAVHRATRRGAKVIVTNANHPSITDLYRGIGKNESLARTSVISGKNAGRQNTTELIIRCNL